MNPAGKYRHYGAWHRFTRPYADDAYKGPVVAGDTVVATLPFAIRPVRASEVQKFGKQAGEVTHVLRTPFYASATFHSDDWVMVGTRKFKLVAPPVNVDEEDVVIELACLEVEGNV